MRLKSTLEDARNALRKIHNLSDTDAVDITLEPAASVTPPISTGAEWPNGCALSLPYRFRIPNDENAKPFLTVLRKLAAEKGKRLKIRGRGPRNGKPYDLPMPLSTSLAVYIETK